MSNDVTIHFTAKDDTGAVLAELRMKMEKSGEDMGKAQADGFAKGSKQTEKEAKDAAERVKSAFNPLLFAGLSGGMPAAAAIGAAGTVAALSVVPMAFVGLAAIALHSNRQITDAFSTLKVSVVSDTQSMAQVMAGPLAQSARDLSQTFNQLKPQITDAMVASVPAVKLLTGAVSDLAINTMPGLVAATKASEAPLQGLRVLLGQTGGGLSDMFTNLTKGSESAGRNMGTLGTIIRDLLGFTGALFANVSNGASGPLTSLQVALKHVEGALTTMTSAGGPVLGFFNGFSTTATGALAALHGVINILNLLPPTLGQAAGSFLAVNMVMDSFGFGAKKAFDGFGKSISDAKGVADKFQAGMSGLASAALSPALLATVGLSAGLAILGQVQQDAARYTQNQASMVQTLTAALKASNGAIDASVTSTAAATLTSFQYGNGTRNLISDLKNVGIAAGTATDAYLGNNYAQQQINYTLDGLINQHVKMSGEINGKTVPVLDKEGQKFQSLKDAMAAANKHLDAASQAQRDQSEAAGQATESTSRLASAMDTLKSSTATAKDKTTALKDAYDELHGITPSYLDAVKSMDDANRQFSESVTKTADKTKGWGAQLLNADGTIRTVTANGSALYDTTNHLSKGFDTASVAVRDLTSRGYTLDEAVKTVRGNLQTQRDEFIRTASQMGLTAQQARNLADKYGLIPDKVNTVINADINPALGNLNYVQGRIDMLHGKTVTVYTSFVDVTSPTSQTGRSQMYAKGGLVGYASGGQVSSIPGYAAGGAGIGLDIRPGGLLSGPGTGTSDDILARVSNGEFVMPADKTKKYLSSLQAMQMGVFNESSGAAISATSGGSGGGQNPGFKLTIDSKGSRMDDLIVELIRNAIRIQGGNAQTVLGTR